MASQEVAENSLIEIEVADDRLRASISLRQIEGAPLPSQADILAQLANAGLVINDSVKERVEAFCVLLDKEEEIPQWFTVATGQPVQEGSNEEFVWDASFERNGHNADSDDAVDYYTFNSIVTVEKDVPIGRITPLVPGKNGVDVHGETIRPRQQPVALELADTVRRTEDDPAQIVAAVAGRVLCAKGRLAINEVLEIRGDVDFDSGNIDSSIDVSITGTVRDRFEVESTKSISVGGAVEAARAHATQNVAVRGGIVARHEGSVIAGGDIGARFCDEADLEAGGNVIITREMINCHMHIEGKLVATRGALIGGRIHARKGMDIGTMGSEAYVPTRVCVGIHPAMIKEAQQIEEAVERKLQTIEKVRQTVQPLMQNLKRLGPAQREQATELLFKADEAEAEINEDRKRREELLGLGETADVQDKPRILVTKTVHPGVMISIGARAATIHEELKGPVVIEERRVDKVTEIAAVNQLTGSVCVLPNTIIPIDELVKGFEEENGVGSSLLNARRQESAPQA